MDVFHYDHMLPSLPIPELQQTSRNLKELLRPLADGGRWTEECRVITRFFSENGDAARLQRLLSAWRAEQAGNDSWLRPFWDDCYLSFRDMLPVNMNYCFQLTENRWDGNGLARMISALCRLIAGRREDLLPPEPAKNGYLSMDMLRNCFCTRIPNPVRDFWRHPPPGGPLHVAVVCRGRWFILSMGNRDGTVAYPSAVRKALAQIRKWADEAPWGEGVGAITCTPRETAFQMRTRLLYHQLNRLSLDSIEKALFVVCLDEPPGAGGNFGCNALGGDAANRWFDKSLQIICDGTHIGMNMEHSGCDAGIWAHLLTQVDHVLSEEPVSTEQDATAAHVRRLEWNIGEGLAGELREARESLGRVTDSLLIGQRKLRCISRDRVKAVGCSPDAAAQMLFQAAYYKLTGRLRSVYESVSTRGFYEGRTDCARPLTVESAAFVRAFADGAASPEKVRELFREAERVHGAGIKYRQSIMGPERHLLGLDAMRQMYGGTEKPEIFSLESYRELIHDTLSTSGIVAPSIAHFGFGPVVRDGLGIGYGLDRDALHLMVTAYPESGVDACGFISVMEELAQKWIGLFLAEAV